MVITSARSRLVAAALAIAGFALPLAASAQDAPSYAQPASANSDETITGRIASIDGTFNITVNDDRGFADHVEMYQGTIINPTGLTLADGMTVTIQGYADGSQFVANEIDTPYTLSGPAPEPAYYGPGWWYPGFAYGYGPAFTLGIIFGSGNSWHAEHERFHGHPWAGSDGHPYGPHPVTFIPPARRGAEPIRRAPAPAVRAPEAVTPPANTTHREPAPIARRPAPVTPQAPLEAHAPAPVAPQQSIPAYRAPIQPQAPPVQAYHAPVFRAPAPPVQAFHAPAPAFRAPAPQFRMPAQRVFIPHIPSSPGH
jgi:hypothetical protein